MTWPQRIRVVEVGPRDGLQNEPEPLGVAVRVELIGRLAAAGLMTVEAGAFVAPGKVPQMADTAAVLRALAPMGLGAEFPVLVPNRRGFDDAVSAGARTVAVFVAASDAFSRANTDCTVAQGMERAAAVCAEATARGVAVRGYISCVLGCPYEGAVAPERVAQLAADLLAMGCGEISLGDTIGIGTAAAARTLVERVGAAVPRDRLALHFHDTYGQALTNIYACLDLGIGAVDCSVAGLGGCPYAPGASGNVASEDVVYMLHGLGIATGVDLPALAATGAWISERLGRANRSKAGAAMTARGALTVKR